MLAKAIEVRRRRTKYADRPRQKVAGSWALSKHDRYLSAYLLCMDSMGANVKRAGKISGQAVWNEWFTYPDIVETRLLWGVKSPATWPDSTFLNNRASVSLSLHLPKGLCSRKPVNTPQRLVVTQRSFFAGYIKSSRRPCFALSEGRNTTCRPTETRVKGSSTTAKIN